MTTYVNPFTGQTVSPAQVGYEELTISVDTALEWPINGNDVIDVAANITEITATVSGLNLLMPPATQVSTGQALIIRNIGTNEFTVTDAGGNTIVSISSGVCKYIYVTNNSTANGVWENITFGAGTSAADAGSLAGYGLVAQGATLNQAYSVVNVFSTSTLIPSERAQFVVYEGGAGSLTLPSASAVGNNWFCMIRNSGTGILNILPVGTNTIDGNVSTQLQLTESFVIVSDGTNWNTFGYGQATQFAFTQLALVVTGGTVTLTANQASNLIQEYSGALTSNSIIILPPTVQLYSVNNQTTGSYSLTFKTTSIGASTVSVPQSGTLLLICDGTNVYNANSGNSSTIASLTVGNGSLSTPSIKFSGDLNTGIYLPASGQYGFVVNNTLVGFFDSTGFTSLLGISGGTF